MRLFVLAAVCGLAAGQTILPDPTITVIDGELIMERRQQIDIATLSTTIDNNDALIQSLLQGRGPLSEWSARVENGATETQVRVGQLENTLANSVSALGAQIAASNAQMTRTAATITADASTSAAAAEAAATTRAEDLEARVTADMDTATAALTRSVNAVTATVNGNISALSTSLRNKADNQPKLWSGGCSRHPGSGWHDHCTDRQLYYTAQGKFVKHNNNRDFRSLLNGAMIQFTPWTITYGSGWNIQQIYLNSQSIYYAYSHTRHCWWGDRHANLVFTANIGHRWYVRYHGACGHAYHHGGRLTDHHSRLTVTYLGQATL